MGKYIRRYDSKRRRLHVWAVPTVWVGAPTVKGDKTADLDEIFAKKDETEEKHQEESTTEGTPE